MSASGYFSKMGCWDPGLHRSEESQDQLLPAQNVVVREEGEGTVKG